MDYAKSSGWEIGMVIEHHEWVEGTEIKYQRSDIGVGTGPNIYALLLCYYLRQLDYKFYDTFYQSTPNYWFC